MGRIIEEVAQSRGHHISLRISTANKHELDAAHLAGTNVAIEFTVPESAQNNVQVCLNAGTRVVCGTTGWNEGLKEANALAKEKHLAFLHASNFSIGVNIFFEINKLLASLMKAHPEYNVAIEETHHTHKKDAPSGTAITLAEQILKQITTKKTWALNFEHNADILPIIAHRIEHVPGTHNVKYSSAIDDIEIVHTAHSREGFALGAVLAAEYIADKQGIFSIRDVLFG